MKMTTSPRLATLLLAFQVLLLAASSHYQRVNRPDNAYLDSSRAGGLVAALERRSRCSAERELEMDACAARMGFLGDHKFRVPKNSSAMDSFCTQLKGSIDCIQGYSRDCLQGFTKQILNSLLKRGKQQFSSICSMGSARMEFMDKMSCLTDDKIEQFHRCMDASIARFEFIRNKVKPENRLPGLCCSYNIFFADTNATISRLCGDANSANKFVQKLISGTTGDFLRLICDGHRSLEECRSSNKTSDTLTKLEQVTKSAKSGQIKSKSKSLIPPLLDILDSSDQV